MKLPPLAEFDSETQRAAFMRAQGWTVLPLRDVVFDHAGNQVAVRACGFRYVEPRPIPRRAALRRTKGTL